MSPPPMVDMANNTYYKRLAKLALWPLIGFNGLVLLFVISEIIVLYLKYVPDILEPVQQLLSPKMLAFLEASINKIIIHLGVWIFVLLVVNSVLIYVVWNVRQFLRTLDTD